MSRPFVIWVTAVISTILSVVAAWGLLKIILQVPQSLSLAGGLWTWRLVLGLLIQAAMTTFFVAVAYAAFVRPRWARVVCAVFAVLITMLVIYAGFHPDPHPLLAIKPGAEAVGAAIGRMAMSILFCVYAYKMLAGAKVRTYFRQSK